MPGVGTWFGRAGILDLFDVEFHAVTRFGGGPSYLLHLFATDQRRDERTQEKRRGDDTPAAYTARTNDSAATTAATRLATPSTDNKQRC